LNCLSSCVLFSDNFFLPKQSFKGSMPKLAVHAVGARVVESIFMNLPAKTTVALKQELYGPHFSLFTQELTGTPTLKSNLESATTDTQKAGATKFVKEILSKGMTKSFYGFTYFQELFAEYMDVADPSDIRTMASSVADHSIHLLSTRSGSRVVAACASYGTPKDRKRMCKSLKGYTSSSLLHRDAYLALLRLVQVTDDTVSIHKSVLNEILSAPKDAEKDGASPLLDLALSETASKLFLLLLVEDGEARMKYFNPYEQSILEPQPTISENGKDVPTSKKDPEMRRQELKKHISKGLEELCANHAAELLTSLPGARVIKEVYCSLPSGEVVDSILEVCESSLAEGDGEDDENVSLFEHPVGHRSIKNLILSDAEKETPLFSEKFFEQFSDRLMDVAKSNRGAFVVAALFKVASLRPKLLNKLKSMEKQLKQQSTGKGANAGHAALLKEVASS
jgi:pumilio family protein 6